MVQNWSLKAPKNRKLFRNCRKNYLIIGAEDYDKMKEYFILEKKKWYFISEIVLTYCEKKIVLFSD